MCSKIMRWLYLEMRISFSSMIVSTDFLAVAGNTSPVTGTACRGCQNEGGQGRGGQNRVGNLPAGGLQAELGRYEIGQMGFRFARVIRPTYVLEAASDSLGWQDHITGLYFVHLFNCSSVAIVYKPQRAFTRGNLQVRFFRLHFQVQLLKFCSFYHSAHRLIRVFQNFYFVIILNICHGFLLEMDLPQ